MVMIRLKTEDQTVYRKPHRKVIHLQSKLYLFLKQLELLGRNPPEVRVTSGQKSSTITSSNQIL